MAKSKKNSDEITPADRALIEQNALFYGMNFGGIEYMLEYCFIRELETGDILLHPDKPNENLYLILEGILKVQIVKNEVLAKLTAGDCAGEISLIDRKCPTATVIAACKTRLLAIPQYTVWSIIGYSHEIARNLLGIMAGRIRHDKVTLIEARNLKTHFEHQAYVDALTGVYNRHWMKNGFTRALSRCIFEKRPFALMIIDIDHFKKINDTYGHLVGDVALKVLTKAISESLRPYDLLVRYGGEEFLVFLFDAKQSEVMSIANRVRCTIAKTTICYDTISFHTTISIGITANKYDATLEKLISEADQALYHAKNTGRNKAVVFDEIPTDIQIE